MTAPAPTYTSNPTPASTNHTPVEQTMPPLSLTLILAATPSLGIGKNGTLPWPQLRKEMAYFRRVTTRVPPLPSSSSTSNPTPSAATDGGKKRLNAVIMGRKTWDSIPPRFRPLSDRLNIVITRDPSAFTAKHNAATGYEGPIAVSSVREAVDRLRNYNSDTKVEDDGAEDGAEGRMEDGTGGKDIQIERVFVIGGATIYEQALDMPETERVLLTRVEEEFECDTFFKVDLEGERGWRRCKGEEVDGWTGEESGTGSEVVEEKGVRFGFAMYERVG